MLPSPGGVPSIIFFFTCSRVIEFQVVSANQGWQWRLFPKSHAERSAADAQGVPEPPAAACTRSTTAAAESMDGVMEAMLAHTYDVQTPVERSPTAAAESMDGVMEAMLAYIMTGFNFYNFAIL